MQSDRVTVVIPTYNEVANLPLIAEAVTDHGYRLLIVDDGSPDGTGELADQLARDSALISVLHRPSKQGLGPAYGQAFGQLVESGQSDCIVQMDADFSHDPAAIPALVDAVDRGADLAIGSRYVPGGSMPDWPWARRMISRGGNLYARLLRHRRVPGLAGVLARSAGLFRGRSLRIRIPGRDGVDGPASRTRHRGGPDHLP